MENLSTFNPRQRAARKWPSSWTKIEPPKKITAKPIPQALPKSSWKESGMSKKDKFVGDC
jgi:hypothetical protein